MTAVALLAAACASDPTVTEPPSQSVPGPTQSTAPLPSEVPFEPAAWPVNGSACGATGYRGRIGRIEAPDALTVRFTLCAPDGAFLARIALPGMAILDTAALERLAADPGTGRSLAGTGPYRIEAWDAGGDVILAAAGTEATASSRTPTVVLRAAADATQRTFELQSATVDGIDAPGPLDLDRIETQPELAILPRPGLATAYLAFGDDAAFDNVRVRRAIAGSLDREALAAGAFPAGSVATTQLVPCAIAGACAGKAWYAFNGPAAAAELAAVRFDLQATYALHVPNRAVAGLPNPLRAAEAVKAQLKESIGMEVAIDEMPVKDYQAGLTGGKLDGLYLGGLSSNVADPAAFLSPTVGQGVASSPAKRARGVAEALAEAAATPDAAAREAAFGRANDALRGTAALVPLVHPGSVLAFRSDVQGAVASPLGIEPLGAFVPGDRRQLVFMQATEPAGAYCGDQRSADAYRLCALVTEPLYGFAAGTMTVEPRLAERCTPDAEATTWTCTLRAGVTFHDGALLDAGDVLASYVAQWDASQPLRVASPDATFGTWQGLFGGFLPVTGSPG
jgi:ABC-type transport system substrate-binding protein